MAKAVRGDSKNAEVQAIAITGFKSLLTRQRIELRPLTVLAGANSSGKSSLIQPLLLLKQTLDAPYDPGPLLLNGPNVRLTSADQLLARIPGKKAADRFVIEFETPRQSVELRFHRASGKKGLDIESNVIIEGQKKQVIQFDTDPTEVRNYLRKFGLPGTLTKETEVRVIRERSFLGLEIVLENRSISLPIFDTRAVLEPFISSIIHVPGLRGNPARTYGTTAVGDNFPGTFENYVASVVNHWKTEKDARLKELGNHLEKLGLTWKVEAKPIDDTQVELIVGRLPHARHGGASDLVSIADVGFGISQTLPVIVALLTAAPGQLVYLEQPEIHLHPRAQTAMAVILAEAARRGVKVVVETHSQLLLLGIQTLVARGELRPNQVKLHWVQRDQSGATQVTSADLDETGAFGDWPEDFADVQLQADNEYLKAAEAKLFSNAVIASE
jgi:hypothetical protein